MNEPNIYKDHLLKELSGAPLTIIAVVLTCLMRIPNTEKIRRLLARRLLLHAPEVIQAKDLREAFLVLNAIAAYDTSLLSGELWAGVVKRLIAAEVKVGGPYADNGGQPELVANNAIHSLLKSAGNSLPQVEVFLKKTFTNASTVESVAVASLIKDRRDDILHMPIVVAVFRLAASVPLCPPAQPIQKRKADVVLRATRRALQNLPELLRLQGMAIIDELAFSADSDEVALLSYLFQQSIVPENRLSPQLWRQLGVANVLYWLAYKTYDDLLDNEGIPERLSIANVCTRRSIELYQQAMTSRPARAWVRSVFDNIDAINAWELEHARGIVQNGYLLIANTPVFNGDQFLAKRAYAHILGPLIMARYSGVFSPVEQHIIEQAWQHFLIARQLNDDIHDWTEDMFCGRLTFVVADMLRSLEIAPGKYDLYSLKQRLQVYFWQDGLEHYGQLIVEHTKEAKRLFKTIPGLRIQHELHAIIDNHEQAVEAALIGHRNEKAFLEAYR